MSKSRALKVDGEVCYMLQDTTMVEIYHPRELIGRKVFVGRNRRCLACNKDFIIFMEFGAHVTNDGWCSSDCEKQLTL